MKHSSPKPSSTPQDPSVEFMTARQEQIRQRAFELYVEHGRENGHELDDWLQAESEVAQHARKSVAA